jgi:hypothetical protein
MLTMRWMTVIAGLGALAISGGAASASTLTHAYDFSSTNTIGSDTYAVDLVGISNGLLVGDAGISGGALALHGAGRVDFSDFMIPTDGSSFSVYLRVQGDAAGGIQEFISQGSSGGPGFYIGPNGASDTRLSDSHGSTGVAFPYDAAFHDLLLTNDQTNNLLTFYIDGASVYTGTAIGIGAGGTPTRLGAQFASHGEYFAGQYDAVRIFTGVATAAETTAAIGPASGEPEPASWALMLLGFGGLGAVLRRQRRAALA